MVKNNLPNFAGFVSSLGEACLFVIFEISHQSRSPLRQWSLPPPLRLSPVIGGGQLSSKFQNCSKIQGKIGQLIFSPLLKSSLKLGIAQLRHYFQTPKNN